MVGTKGEVGYAAPSGSSNHFVFEMVRVRIQGSMQIYQPDRYYQMLSICTLVTQINPEITSSLASGCLVGCQMGC